MQVKAWVHVTWRVPGAGHRNEKADEGIRRERSVLDLVLDLEV